jgi:hypothetical protein
MKAWGRSELNSPVSDRLLMCSDSPLAAVIKETLMSRSARQKEKAYFCRRCRLSLSLTGRTHWAGSQLFFSLCPSPWWTGLGSQSSRLASYCLGDGQGFPMRWHFYSSVTKWSLKVPWWSGMGADIYSSSSLRLGHLALNSSFVCSQEPCRVKQPFTKHIGSNSGRLASTYTLTPLIEKTWLWFSQPPQCRTLGSPTSNTGTCLLKFLWTHISKLTYSRIKYLNGSRGAEAGFKTGGNGPVTCL